MAKKSKRQASQDAALDMTPMIDVVFQLIIFFVVTLKQEDKLAYLDALAPQGNSSSQSTTIEQTKIVVFAGEGRQKGADPQKSTTLNCMIDGDGRTMSKTIFERELWRIAKSNKEAPVIISCTKDSDHKTLVYVLEQCTIRGLKNLAIMTI